MAEYREYIVRETTFPLGGTRQEVVGEVVRCNDCILWKIETEPLGIECECGETAHYCSIGGITRSNDFCNYGERRKNESCMVGRQVYRP